MAADDCAILVGVSNYLDETNFKPLKGPPLDLELMQTWLTSPAGGAVPKNQVVRLRSPLKPPHADNHSAWKPRPEQFADAFRRVTSAGPTGPMVQRGGRLYLYFSGHGFSRYTEKEVSAALLMASATRLYPDHVWGTSYAHRARDQALFSEVVLVMDCCRDEEFNFPLSPAVVNESRDESGSTRLLAIYGAPQGGKAQEREFASLNGRTCSLLTFALLKGLRETPPDAAGRVSGSALKSFIEEGWEALCGDVPADRPAIVTPDTGDIYFTSTNARVQTWFRLNSFNVKRLVVEVQNYPGTVMARIRLDVDANMVTVEYPQEGKHTASPVGDGRVALLLNPGFYRCVLTGDRRGTLNVEAKSAGLDVQL